MPVPGIPERVLVAPDKFKGTFRATEVAAALGRGLEAGGCPPPDLCPVADGGEGTLEVLLTALGGETAAAPALDPLGRPLTAGFGLLEGGDVAVVEVAAASGLALLRPDEREAEAASSGGTGMLIAAAVDAGAAVVLVAAGGSATTDGGAGAIEAVREAGGLRGARLVVLSDVRTPYERAAEVFAPQKGADPAAVARLRARLDAFAATLPRDPRGVAMGGAAGGLAGGLWAAFGAVLEPGAAFVLGELGFESRLRAARAVLVGEGRIDASTLEGKVAGEIATAARQAGVPCFAVVGEDGLGRFGARILDLQRVVEARTLDEVEAAGGALAAELRPPAPARA